MSVLKRSKLTLVVDPAVVQRAKSYASAHNTSVSALVESYLKNLTVDSADRLSENPETWPETARSLYGILDDVDTDAEAVRLDHLTKKYLHD